jgi:hypothetical protein
MKKKSTPRNKNGARLSKVATWRKSNTTWTCAWLWFKFLVTEFVYLQFNWYRILSTPRLHLDLPLLRVLKTEAIENTVLYLDHICREAGGIPDERCIPRHSAEIAESDRGVWSGCCAWGTAEIDGLTELCPCRSAEPLGCPRLKFWFLFSYCLWGGCYSDGTECVSFFSGQMMWILQNTLYTVCVSPETSSQVVLFFFLHHFGSSRGVWRVKHGLCRRETHAMRRRVASSPFGSLCRRIYICALSL